MPLLAVRTSASVWFTTVFDFEVRCRKNPTEISRKRGLELFSVFELVVELRGMWKPNFADRWNRNGLLTHAFSRATSKPLQG